MRPGSGRRVVGPLARILPPMRRPSSRAVALGLILLLSVAGGAAGQTAASAPRTARPGSSAATASTLDPAAQGDVTSASISAQLFETLTTFDADLRLQPALAQSWQVDEGGTRVVFHLRPGPLVLRRDAAAGERRRAQLAPPDRPGAPLAAGIAPADRRWRHRVPRRRVGRVGRRPARRRRDRRRDRDPRPTRVGLPGRRRELVVRRSCRRAPTSPARSRRATASSAAAATSRPRSPGTSLTLRANGRYWAGRPAIDTIEAGGRPRRPQRGRGVRGRRARLRPDLLVRCDVDRLRPDPRPAAPRGPDDVGRVLRLRHDPASRSTTSGSARRSAMAVDWRRIARLGSPDGAAAVATSMVPPGVPGRSDAGLPADVRPGGGPDAAGGGRAIRAVPGSRRSRCRRAAGRSMRRSSTRSAASSASSSRPRRWTSSPTSTGSRPTRRRSGR